MNSKKYHKLDESIEKNMDPLVKEIFLKLNECYWEDLKNKANKFLDTVFGKNFDKTDTKQ